MWRVRKERRVVDMGIKEIRTVDEPQSLALRAAFEAGVRQEQSERRRWAREVHDIVAHSVSAIVVLASAATLAGGEAGTVEPLRLIEQTSRRAMAELRRLMAQLADEPSSGHDEITRLADLPDLVQTVRACGVAVDFEAVGEPCSVSGEVEHTTYRIVQEGLTNVVKHAGAPGQAKVRLDWAGGGVSVRITNPIGGGSSHPELSTGRGLTGLHERLCELGGSFEAGPVDGSFMLAAQLPEGRAVAMATRR
jgi:signal transduction histidine kinase